MEREQIKELPLVKTLEDLNKWLARAVELHGDGSYASLHEMRGAISEEYQELMEALHSRNSVNIARELKDLAVVAIWGLACLKAGTIP